MSFPQACIQLFKNFDTNICWGVDKVPYQPCMVAEKYLEDRNQFFNNEN